MDSCLDNPFCKESFQTYRDWEDALLCFFVTEASHPHLSDWEKWAMLADQKNVAYSALLLSSMVQSKPRVSKSSTVLADFCQKLGGNTNVGLADYNVWLKTNWVNVARIASRFKTELAHPQSSSDCTGVAVRITGVR